ncbi:MAG TPA: aldose 1-epimerase family protein [Holophagaceae bacterium]|jgi:galactose mutarotase-like enzyme|nr:aldose 1-epimerase family protein [Holophagaceae bacterium]
MIHLQHGEYEAEVAPLGAELTAFRWRGLDLLWEGDPRWWGRRAPVLFPIVGRLNDDTLRHAGRSHHLPQHGFARDLLWETLGADGRSTSLRLRDSSETRGAYPFAFELTQRLELSDGGLQAVFTLANPGVEDLIACLGVHPAFRWPLPGGRRDEHQIIFEADEPEPMRRLKNGLLREATHPSPLTTWPLLLKDTLFADDALIFDRLRSRRLRFTAPGAPVVELAWDFPHFGIWTRPGAPFLCLEPWQGFADQEGFAGGFRDKPGTVRLAPGGARRWSYCIAAREALP